MLWIQPVLGKANRLWIGGWGSNLGLGSTTRTDASGFREGSQPVWQSSNLETNTYCPLLEVAFSIFPLKTVDTDSYIQMGVSSANLSWLVLNEDIHRKQTGLGGKRSLRL